MKPEKNSGNDMGDALADVLKTIRLSARTYFCTHFASPWAMEMEKSPECMFHVVVNGSCWVKIEQDAEPIRLGTRDIIAFPTGAAHWIGDTVNTPRLPGREVVEGILSGHHPFQISDNESCEPVLLMCGSFSYDSSIDHPFLKDLPCHIHVKAQEDKGHWLDLLVVVLSTESRTASPGSTVIVDRLSEVLFIQLMRAHMREAPDKMEYMSALMDAQIGRALNRIHSETSASFSVKTLGESVALSRTAFTEKFTRLVGIPPKTYLINWRMQKAKTRLETANESMISIAEAAGYSSEAAFSKAFKQYYDITPGQIRRSSNP